MIKNINLETGTFELNGQIIKIPPGIDILQYIDSEVESIDVIEVNSETEQETEKTEPQNLMAEPNPEVLNIFHTALPLHSPPRVASYNASAH